MKDVKNHNFTQMLAIFWLIFWLFNGFDKFLFHTDIGWLTWYGKDRDWQFLTYFTITFALEREIIMIKNNSLGAGICKP